MAPLVRIILRYGIGLFLGMEAGDIIAGDPDAVAVGVMALGAAVEGWYWLANRYDWTK